VGGSENAAKCIKKRVCRGWWMPGKGELSSRPKNGNKVEESMGFFEGRGVLRASTIGRVRQ